MSNVPALELHSATARPESERRVFGLDLLRCIAILIVVYGHGLSLILPFVPKWVLYLPLPDGVDLFFVLSGFLIGTILIKTYERTRFTPMRVLHFWGRRWLRTLPNYLLVLTLVILVAKLTGKHGDPVQTWRYYLFVQNFSSPQPPFFPESWSLAVEEWFYLTTPVMLLLLHNYLCKWCWGESTMWVVIGLNIGGITAYRCWQAVGIPDTDPGIWDRFFRTITLMRLDSIMYGVAAAVIKYYHPKFWIRHAGLGLFLGLLLLLITQCFLVHARFIIENCGFFYKGPYFSVVSVATMCLLPYLDGMRTRRGSFARAVTHISVISYSLYLINGTLVLLTFHAYFAARDLTEALTNMVLFWALSIAAATLLYYGFEKPVLELRDKIAPKRAKIDTIS